MIKQKRTEQVSENSQQHLTLSGGGTSTGLFTAFAATATVRHLSGVNAGNIGHGRDFSSCLSLLSKHYPVLSGAGFFFFTSSLRPLLKKVNNLRGRVIVFVFYFIVRLGIRSIWIFPIWNSAWSRAECRYLHASFVNRTSSYFYQFFAFPVHSGSFLSRTSLNVK